MLGGGGEGISIQATDLSLDVDRSSFRRCVVHWEVYGLDVCISYDSVGI